MANYSTNLKSWGASGSAWPDGYKYVEGEQPVDDWDNFFASNVISDVKDHLIPLTNSRIESDKGGAGGEPGSPEASHLYHDQGNERLRLWDASASQWHDLMHRDGDTMTGVLDMGGYKIHDSTGTLTLGGTVNATGTLNYGGNQVATRTWVNNNADVPNADYADGADTVDGWHKGDIKTWVNNNADVPNADYADDADTVDGKHASDLGTDVSDSGNTVVAAAGNINFDSGATVEDDGDGTVTVESRRQQAVQARVHSRTNK